ncbi:uncharacterized protein LOC135395552 [Ornithodoros turicata]|uniref:uncharacterized protein LOC135395552 n=1 Tax=Ornithodoros turicata TaxID=34597 RepID=UPI00313940F9
MQQNSTVKPVQFMTRKHVFPTNLEKMNVKRAVQLLSTPVSAALKCLQEQAGHACDLSFANAASTIKFMEIIHRWFLLMDVSNCTQHIHQNRPECKEYRHTGDERLGWLEDDFLSYLNTMKKESTKKQFLSQETYEGLVFTTLSNVNCVKFVLTRKMSSDPIESFFGWLRKSSGGNDQTDARTVVSGIEKALVTGIISVSANSNVLHDDSTISDVTLPHGALEEIVSSRFPQQACQALVRSLSNPQRRLATPDDAALSMVGGYLARCVKEKLDCDLCFAMLVRPQSCAPADRLIHHQDRGGLLYPSYSLMHVLFGLKDFIETFLSCRGRKLKSPLQQAVNNAVDVLTGRDELKCPASEHHRRLLTMLCTKFFRQVLTNYAMTVTDKCDLAKIFFAKPISRKALKV